MELDSAENPGRFFSALSRDLKSLALSNIQYFQSGRHSHHAKFHVTFSLLYEYLDIGIEPSYRELSKHLSQYDFSPDVKGNGYRSLLRVVQKCCLHLLQLCRYISSVRDSILFRKKVYAKELESYVSALGQLRAILYYALKLVHYCQEGELFVDESKLNTEIAEQLVLDVESLSQESFYGRCLGFQFCSSMHRPMQALAIAMASYSEGFLESSQVMQVATSVFNSGKYFMDPELRAQQMVKVTRTMDIRFCKAFWGFSESALFHQLPSFVCPSVDVNTIITLGPDAFELPLTDGSDTVVITPPCAHTGPGHTHVRLISAHLREGQQSTRKPSKAKSPSSNKPRTPGLVIHIHGGGFVAQSSKSHEVYLREWAVTLGVPIVSVDYSLAPELPFPRALEECFYAYAWAVQNCEQLGSTGERIVLVGDSAGGNLAISTAMRAGAFGIRPPHGIVAIYPCTVVRYTPSPARLLSLLDPVLPVGLVSRCLAAYAGINEEHPLSSPKTDDVHSQQSLTRIQLGSYETTDSDWMLVAQDEEEANKIQSQAANVQFSPDPDMATKSVIDSLDDSFPGKNDSLSPAQESRPPTAPPHIGERGRTDTNDSEEIEIFSRLQSDGSCIFPSGSSVVDGKMDTSLKCKKEDSGLGPSQKMSADNETEKMEGESEHEPGDKSANQSTYSNFQERAKLMMEGAQTIITSLSSYIPSTADMSAHSVMSSVSSLLSTTTQASPMLSKVKETSETPGEYFTDIDVNSDPVDNMSGQSSDVAEGEGVSTMPDSYTATDEKDPMPSEQLLHTDAMDISDGTAAHQNLLDGHTEISSHDNHVTRAPSQSDLLAQNVSPDSDVVLDDLSTTSLPSSSSQAFDTAHSSPLSPQQPQLPASASLDNIASVSLSSESSSHHGYHSAGERLSQSALPSPSSDTALASTGEAGMTNIPLVDEDIKPAADSVQRQSSLSDVSPCPSDGAFPSPQLELCAPSPSNEPFPPQQLEVHAPNPNEQPSPSPQVQPQAATDLLSGDNSPQDGADILETVETAMVVEDTEHNQDAGADVQVTETSSETDSPVVVNKLDVPDEEKSQTLVSGKEKQKTFLTGEDKQNTFDLDMLSPEAPVAVFCEDDMSSGPMSPSLLPSLPEENKQLLEDALQSVDLSPPQPPEPMVVCDTETTDQVSSGSHGDSVGDHQTENTSSTGHDDSLDVTPVKLQQSELTQMSHDTDSSHQSSSKQTPQTQTKPPKPPTSLSLTSPARPRVHHTSPLSPTSPSQVFGNDPEEPFETVESDIGFHSSRLEVQFFSPSAEEMGQPFSAASPTASRSDGFLRSSSVPSIATLVSPNPSTTSTRTAASTAVFPNGLKTGMSPTDFEKQTYTTNSPLHTLRKAPVVKNPYMSPLLAPEDLLRGLPRVSIVGCHLDPLLDDSVSFARRLQKLEMPVSLHLVDDLPHGFLNFCLLSYEAKQASALCCRKIQEMLESSGV